jgi:hypothetical protein
MESSTLPDTQVIAASTDMVGVASHIDNDHGTTEVTENGRKVTRCKIYPNISCEDHMRTAEVGKLYLKGRFAAPVSLWCDPAGKELFRKYGFRQPEVFQADLKEALGKVSGTRIAKSEYDQQARPLEEGEAALKSGKYKAAIEAFTAAAKGKIEGLRKAAEGALGNLKSTAVTMLDRARRALEAGKSDRAREMLVYLADEFGALEAGREAAELLKKIDVQDKDKGR